MKRKFTKSVVERFESKITPEPNTGCWLWTAGLFNGGYGQFNIGNIKIAAHRFSYEVYKGKIKKGLLVCHRCDVRSCVNPDHLFLGTYKDNNHDMKLKGRANTSNMGKGSLHQNAKFTEDDILEIIRLRTTGKTYTEIGNLMGTSRQNAYMIAKRINWKHV